jgi:hypothetical protein
MFKTPLFAIAVTACLAAPAVAAPGDYKVEGTAKINGNATELMVKVLNVPTGKLVGNAKVWHFSSHQMAKGPSPMEMRHVAAPDGKDGYRLELPLHLHGQQFEHFMISVPGESEPIHARIQIPVAK